MSNQVETENKREGLEPCPFCGCRDAMLVTCEIDGLPEADEDYFVRCKQCFARGPYRQDEKHAIEYWNDGILRKRHSAVMCDTLDLAKRITLEVKFKHMRQWRWRIKLASWLFDLIARIGSLGGIEFVEVDNEEAQEATKQGHQEVRIAKARLSL